MSRWLAALVVLGLGVAAEAQYTRNRVRFLGQVPLAVMSGSPTSGSGCAGYVSPGGREYAIMGVRNGTVVVDITNPTAPVQVGHIAGLSSIWREVAVLGQYAYVVTEATGGGVQIIDLRQADVGSVSLAATFTFSTSNRVHTVQASEATKTVYLNGTSGYAGGGVTALDCTNPTAPVILGSWTGTYIHDLTIWIPPTGPYAGREILFACVGSQGLRILDAGNKANIVQIGTRKYLDNGTYCHSGVVSPDGKYFYANDEFDENTGVFGSATTHIFDIQDLTNPLYLGRYESGVGVIDHNSMVQNGHIQLAAYKGGLRVYNIRRTTPVETGFFDTHPEGEGFDYEGAWGVFAGYPSGNVVISDINRGLFVLDPSEAEGFGAPILSVAGDTGQVIAKRVRKRDGVVHAFPAAKRTVVDLTLETGVSSPASLKVLTTARSRSRSGHSLNVFLKRNGKWESVLQANLDGKAATLGSKGVSAAGAVSGSGTIEVRIETTSRSLGAWELDAAQVIVD